VTTTIYGLIDPRTGLLRYVGKTQRPARRLASHIAYSRKGHHTHACRWIRCLLREGLKPVMQLIEVCEGNGCPQEIFHIRLARADGCKLTNATGGGEGTGGALYPPERRQAMSERSKAMWKQPGMRERLVAAWKGKEHSAESRAKMSAVRKGVPKPEDWKQRVRATLAGRNTAPIESRRAAAQKRKSRGDVFFSPETQRKAVEAARAATLGKKRPAEYCARMSAMMKGRPSPLRNRKQSTTVVAKRVAAFQSRPDYKELLHKFQQAGIRASSESRRGKPLSEETKRKIAHGNKGKPSKLRGRKQTPEVAARRAIALRAAYGNVDERERFRVMLKSVRRDADLGQRTFAELAGITQALLSSYEHESKLPSECMIVRIRTCLENHGIKV
jgi:DNA-binding XRE family transcriptional regulator